MNLNLMKLKIAQANNCMTIDQIVKETGLARATVSKTFNGKGKPSPKTIGLIAKVLGIDVMELIKDEKINQEVLKQ